MDDGRTVVISFDPTSGAAGARAAATATAATRAGAQARAASRRGGEGSTGGLRRDTVTLSSQAQALAAVEGSGPSQRLRAQTQTATATRTATRTESATRRARPLPTLESIDGLAGARDRLESDSRRRETRPVTTRGERGGGSEVDVGVEEAEQAERAKTRETSVDGSTDAAGPEDGSEAGGSQSLHDRETADGVEDVYEHKKLGLENIYEREKVEVENIYDPERLGLKNIYEWEEEGADDVYGTAEDVSMHALGRRGRAGNEVGPRLPGPRDEAPDDPFAGFDPTDPRDVFDLRTRDHRTKRAIPEAWPYAARPPRAATAGDGRSESLAQPHLAFQRSEDGAVGLHRRPDAPAVFGVSDVSARSESRGRGSLSSASGPAEYTELRYQMDKIVPGPFGSRGNVAKRVAAFLHQNATAPRLAAGDRIDDEA